MKYIDAELLKTELKRRIKERDIMMKLGTYFSTSYVYEDILDLIDSLQKEQPEPSNNLVDVDAVREDFITEVYRVLDADSTNDRANAIIDAFDSLPTVSQEQTEVDLEKELEKYCRIYYNCNYPDQIQNGKCSVVMPHIVEAARHFYELGRKGGSK